MLGAQSERIQIGLSRAKRGRRAFAGATRPGTSVSRHLEFGLLKLDKRASFSRLKTGCRVGEPAGWTTHCAL